MLKFKKNNKKYIWWMVTVGLFGIAGLLLVPIVNYAIKLARCWGQKPYYSTLKILHKSLSFA